MLEAKALNPWNGKVNSFETNYWEMTNEGSTIALKLKSGYSYQFGNDVLKNIARIDLMDSDSENKDALFIADDQDSTTIPYIYLNGNRDEMSGEWGDRMSAVYILPYAREITPSLKNQKHIGHIVAPKVYIYDMNGDVNGCFIAKSLNLTGSESHMFPYHGPKIKNNNSTPEQPGDNTQGGNQKSGTETTDSKLNNDTNNSSTNNEIILNKEELSTNISLKQNTPKISSNKNSKVIVEDNKQTNAKQNDSVKTGDDAHLFMYVLLELLAFAGIVSLRKKA